MVAGQVNLPRDFLVNRNRAPPVQSMAVTGVRSVLRFVLLFHKSFLPFTLLSLDSWSPNGFALQYLSLQEE